MKIKLYNLLKPILAGISLLLIIGVVGGMDQGRIAPVAGMVVCAVLAAVMLVCVITAKGEC